MRFDIKEIIDNICKNSGLQLKPDATLFVKAEKSFDAYFGKSKWRKIEHLLHVSGKIEFEEVMVIDICRCKWMVESFSECTRIGGAKLEKDGLLYWHIILQ